MIVVKTKDFGNEAVINESNIIYIIPAQDGGAIIHLIDQKYIVSTESYLTLKTRLINPVSVPTPVFSMDTVNMSTTTPNIPKNSVSLSESSLPKLANGNIDKRTVQYKEYIQHQQV